MRAALTSRGLAERPGGPPDLTVDYRFTTEDVHTIGIRPRGPLRFTAGMLVIDLHVPGENDPVWRGVYRDEDEASTKLVQRFLKGAEKLVARYPKLK